MFISSAAHIFLYFLLLTYSVVRHFAFAVYCVVMIPVSAYTHALCYDATQQCSADLYDYQEEFCEIRRLIDNGATGYC